MKCKKHPTALWAVFILITAEYLPQQATHGSLHITTMQSGRQSLTGSR